MGRQILMGSADLMVKVAQTIFVAVAVLAVTVLTSLDEMDLKAVGQGIPISDQVQRLARLAKSAGVQGLVCSPHELKGLKNETEPTFG